jgi:hypothetical protein
MGQDDLTKQYSVLFEKKRGKNIRAFLQDVYRSGKSREIVSFMVWELFHKLRLFPKGEYLKFTDRPALSLEQKRVDSPEFHQELDEFFGSRALEVVGCAQNWKILFQDHGRAIFGCLYPNDQDLYKSIDQGRSVIFVKRFPEKIKSIYLSSNKTIFVCILGAVYRSSDGGTAFKKTLDLGSSASFFRFNNAMTETPGGTLMIGEYGNIWEPAGWKNLANLYFSFDDGKTWQRSEFLKEQGTNKHVHIVGYSKLLNRFLVADGDNHKRLWISDPLNAFDFDRPRWKAVNRFHIQMGGYTSFVESDGRILFGTDYQGGTNFLVETTDGRKLTRRIVPDPYRRSPIDNMVLRRSKKGMEIWANLPYSTAGTKCLLMVSSDGGNTWIRVFEYSRTTHTVWLVSSSSEVQEELYFSIEDLQNSTRSVYKISDRE